MKRSIWILMAVILFSACGEKSFTQEGDISYRRGSESCVDLDKNHWLLDIVARDSRDSVYLNTNTLKHKVEVHKLQLDTLSTLYALLSQTCKEDSIELVISALDFYKSLNGTVPLHLKDSEKISVVVNMRDKLSDLEHISYKTLFESNMMAKYVKQNRWNAEQDKASQIYFEKLKTKNGDKITEGKYQISYIIKSLNGVLISKSNDGDPFVYNSQDKGVIKGIRFMVENMTVGESARALVPSSRAYGAVGNSKVPGYMPIIIELEVLSQLD